MSANITCVPDPLEFGHTIKWTVGILPYDDSVQHFNSMGIFVYYPPSNVSVMVVEGRLENRRRDVSCRATDENGTPVLGVTAKIQFYGE